MEKTLPYNPVITSDVTQRYIWGIKVIKYVHVKKQSYLLCPWRSDCTGQSVELGAVFANINSRQ